jgi:tight adherence protein C
VTLLLPVLAFVFVSALIVAAAMTLAPGRAVAIDRRLQELVGGRSAVPDTAPRMEAVVAVLKKVGEKVPRSPKEMGQLRLRLVRAGFRRDEAMAIFFGMRAALAVLLFVLFASPLVTGRPDITYALGAAALGYILPSIVLKRLVKRRMKRILLSLADALDLLVVSVEAGLGLDQALARVGTELSAPYPDLSDELRLLNLELRAGKGRSEALRNLADRTGVEDLSGLVTMLIQTDKFGTSIAQSLRVYSDTLRTKRRQRAEEAAAKTGVKMVFPLVCCIFPAIWVVTIGPAAIKFITVLVPVIQSTKKK